MGDTHKIHVKLGDFEFSGEGAEGTLSEQFDKFLAAIKEAPARKASQQAPSPKASENGQPAVPLASDDALMQRVFKDDSGGLVSLKIMPKGDDAEVDALILILYGYQKLRNLDTVMATDLTSAARLSGVNASRIDRTLSKKIELVAIAGRAKGRKYGLNNRGIASAEDMLAKILN